jgi:hypothetical protein
MQCIALHAMACADGPTRVYFTSQQERKVNSSEVKQLKTITFIPSSSIKFELSDCTEIILITDGVDEKKMEIYGFLVERD